MQQSLERFLGLERKAEVERFIVDEQKRDCLPGARQDTPEQLFVMEQEGCMDIALYIDEDVLGTLAIDDPRRSLHRGNLESFCIALEGVSHFVLLVERAASGRKVSALELEIQAEVDKFVQGILLLESQGRNDASERRWLERLLFKRYALREGLGVDESQRYHAANQVAHRFCRRLQEIPRTVWRKEAQRFYHRSLADKVAA